MGMLTKEDLIQTSQGEEVEQNPFRSDDQIDKVLLEMSQEKQPFEKTIVLDESAEESTPQDISYTDASPGQKKRSNDTAEFIVTMADQGLAVLFANYAHEPDSKNFEADREDIVSLSKYWGYYFQGKEVDMPPWLMALVVTIAVISKKFNMAKQIRLANLRAEAAEAEAQEAKKELEKEKNSKKD